MKKDNDKIVYSPSDLVKFMESEFASWMDRYRLEFPDTVFPDKNSEMDEILFAKGLVHEANFLKELKTTHKVVEISNSTEGYKNTVSAMKEGAEVIYQAVLEKENFRGLADFVVKVPGASTLGDYHYEVWDTKLSKHPKPSHIIQLCCYAEMLAVIQGVWPKQIGVVLGNGKKAFFEVQNYQNYYRLLKQAFLEQMVHFDSQNMPDPGLSNSFGRWRTFAEAHLAERDHLALVANIRKSQIKKLQLENIRTLQSLAVTLTERIARLNDATFQKLKMQAQLQHDSRGKEKPLHLVVPPNRETPAMGLALLPPVHASDVFFDMEGYPLAGDGLEYLFGVTHLSGDKLEFKDFWAHSPEEEKKAFESFVDWVFARYKQTPQMHIYHYASYEVSAMRRLAQRHATREIEIDSLLRGEVFVDLYDIVRHGILVGEPKYSIKNLEHIYMKKREVEVQSAGDSIVYYEKWIKSGQDGHPDRSEILAMIRAYNKDDCDSTYHLAMWLRGLQKDHGIVYLPRNGEQSSVKESTDAEILYQNMLENPRGVPQDQAFRIHHLLAHLLLFHKRESKPVWWAFFDRLGKGAELLSEDINCIGGMTKDVSPSSAERLFNYKFDPEQDTKMKEGSKFTFSHDQSCKGTVEDIDHVNGKITLKLSKVAATKASENLSIIPDEYVHPGALETAIYDTVKKYQEKNLLEPHLRQLLYREKPVIQNQMKSELVDPAKDIVAESIRIIGAMQDSTLCIQGPPGCGKTYTAASVILSLISNGKKVGITSNSHKVIVNLLLEIIKQARASNQSFKALKIKPDDSEALLAHPDLCTFGKKNEDYVPGSTRFNIVAGTAWFFSREEVQGEFDYLFVDEAGQVSLANIVSMSRATKNIVLIGDQMQLSQPAKGTHPEGSGLSSLVYYLEDHETIPPEMGIFLPQTRRMHPHVCEFISDSFYEGRLTNHSSTAEQKIELPPTPLEFLKRGTGIQFVPVDHDGNSQASEEEAAIISKIRTELLGRSYTDRKGQSLFITENDILYVTPYNMQVQLLEGILGANARVGTVDKFQGQEAPVVVISMCASSSDDIPRGIEFLFSKNRLNVAISRAQCLAIVVGCPKLAYTKCGRIADMELVDVFCRVVVSECK